MGKRRGNHPVPGHFTTGGSRTEDPDIAQKSKQAVGREAARERRRAGGKTRLGVAPKEQRVRQPVAPASPVLAAGGPKRREAKAAKARQQRPARAAPARPTAATEPVEQPRYLGQMTRWAVRRAIGLVRAPIAFARAVVDAVREHE